MSSIRKTMRSDSHYSLDDDKQLITESNLIELKSSRNDRFTIKHLHEYISVDDLKYFRRRRRIDKSLKSQVWHCLCGTTGETVNKSKAKESTSLKSEHTAHFMPWPQYKRILPIRRSTVLFLEGLMPLNKSEHQDCYLWYTAEDCKRCRTLPFKRPESLRLNGVMNLEPEYRSSFISYPILDRSTKILPREVFQILPPPHKLKAPEADRNKKESPDEQSKLIQASKVYTSLEAGGTKPTIKKIVEYHPSEYRQQFKSFPIAKAHTIPQLSNIKLNGRFYGVPEYQDRYRMYANYAKLMPLKKADNLRTSGTELSYTSMIRENSGKINPEYREKFHQLSKANEKERPIRTKDHLHMSGKFGQQAPEYHESYRDPHVKQRPVRGKCRDSHLHLQGKFEFNPEYRNMYLDFPRSRPVVQKPVSTFRLPNSNTSNALTSAINSNVEPSKANGHSHDTAQLIPLKPRGVILTPEYRKACYNYQIRRRSPGCQIPPQESFLEKNSLFDSNVARNNAHLEPLKESCYSTHTMNYVRRTDAVAICKNESDMYRHPTSIAEDNKYTRPISIKKKSDSAFNIGNIHDSFVVFEKKPHRNTSHCCTK